MGGDWYDVFELVVDAGPHRSAEQFGRLDAHQEVQALAEHLCVAGPGQGAAQPPQLVTDRVRGAGRENRPVGLQCGPPSPGGDPQVVDRDRLVGAQPGCPECAAR